MRRVLYLDCVAGAAGDMLLAALIDAGASAERVQQGLESLQVPDLHLDVQPVERHGLRALSVQTATADHVHRRWHDVRDIIDAARLPARAAQRAQETFRRLAYAEGRIHGVAPEDVHFHEVGARDALAEICGVALALEELDVDEVECSPLPASRGFVRAAHGVLPLPAPATLELLKGMPVYGVDVDAELVTPTGAALVAALSTVAGPIPAMRVRSTGYGAGSRDLPAIPNVVRVLLGDRSSDTPASSVSLLETNVDDLPAELVPDAVASCFSAGALDVWTTPVQMKKGRPALTLSALARTGCEEPVADAIFRNTSTLGIRVAHLDRLELDRAWETVEVDGQPVRVKLGRLDGHIVNVAPEHDDCATVAARMGRSVKSVWQQALRAASAAEESRA